ARALGDVDGAADVAGEVAGGQKARSATVDDPAIIPRGVAQAVVDDEWLARPRRFGKDCQAAFTVVGVHALHPAIAQFVMQGPAGEVAPALVDAVALAARIGPPDHDRRRIRQGAEAHLALAQPMFGTLAVA